MKKRTPCYVYHYTSPLGPMTMASDGEQLIGLWFDGQENYGSTISDNSSLHSPHEVLLPVFRMAIYWLDTYFSGRMPGLIPPLTFHGTAFRKQVWEQLLNIPYGKTVSYSDIARRIALRNGMERVSAQAVGNAVSHNPISLIVPCHRVIGADKSLTGYAGGIERKRWLLKMEERGEPPVAPQGGR